MMPLVISMGVIALSCITPSGAADQPPAGEQPPSEAALPIDQVCIYASKIYSQGARAAFDGAMYTCVRGADGTMRWINLYAAERSRNSS